MKELTINNIDELIEGVSLPQEIKISLHDRGGKACNHKYEDGVISVLCSKCNEWHPVFELQNGQWVSINKTYWVSYKRGTKDAYFGSKCTACYKGNSTKSKEQSISSIKEEIPKSTGDYKAWSEKNGGVQKTIALTKEHDRYVRLYCALNDININEFFNHIIEKWSKDNQIGL